MNGGAVAYLTHSPYGRNGNEVTNNNSSSYITGNAGGSVSADETEGTTNAYNTIAGMLASTTGNITGVYDLSGGAREYVASYNNNTFTNIVSGNSFASQGGSSTKYATAYHGTSSDVPSSDRCILGDATYEVYIKGNTAWFNDESWTFDGNYPFLQRGGYYHDGSSGGIFFASNYSGFTSKTSSFRIVLPGI